MAAGNKLTIDFAWHTPTDDNMYRMAEKVAGVLDYGHTCDDSCGHIPYLHIRVNDIHSGKGNDYFFGPDGD